MIRKVNYLARRGTSSFRNLTFTRYGLLSVIDLFETFYRKSGSNFFYASVYSIIALTGLYILELLYRNTLFNDHIPQEWVNYSTTNEYGHTVDDDIEHNKKQQSLSCRHLMVTFWVSNTFSEWSQSKYMSLSKRSAYRN